ncbi:hypothetical protein BC936DRAFT_139442 [Jimgerdemannia flammicorona]|uniref:Uncharacterized protein n=1 Tax=Jimgerdemannia flammicorona TaxID=994334 RepID=A0A433BA18_9FUNG|nr:hypothetical protein BC936DRAFT_139442 [Jimgerdemannia flammicorona]
MHGCYNSDVRRCFLQGTKFPRLVSVARISLSRWSVYPEFGYVPLTLKSESNLSAFPKAHLSSIPPPAQSPPRRPDQESRDLFLHRALLVQDFVAAVQGPGHPRRQASS